MPEGNGVNFRLKQAREILQHLEHEIEHYESAREKYKTLRKLAVGSTASISILLSVTELILSLTGFGAAVGGPLEPLVDCSE